MVDKADLRSPRHHQPPAVSAIPIFSHVSVPVVVEQVSEGQKAVVLVLDGEPRQDGITPRASMALPCAAIATAPHTRHARHTMSISVWGRKRKRKGRDGTSVGVVRSPDAGEAERRGDRVEGVVGEGPRGIIGRVAPVHLLQEHNIGVEPPQLRHHLGQLVAPRTQGQPSFLAFQKRWVGELHPNSMFHEAMRRLPLRAGGAEAGSR